MANQSAVRHDVEHDLVVPDDGLTLLADDMLLDLVRGGSSEAYAVLFERYRYPAHRLATYFSNSVDAKDIVAETFADVLHQLRRGKGPHTSFRSYLFTSVRREAGKRARLHKRVSPTDDMATIDKPVPFGGGGVDTFERELVRAAFASLPKRWQTVLWQLDVDGRKPHELASRLGIKPNAVSALAYRAREGLRRAYLEQHVMTNTTSWATACEEVRRRLVAGVRGSATTRDVITIDPHLETCSSCTDVYLELEEVNTHLGAVSSALAIGFAAPTVTLLSETVAKATFIAKSIAAIGSSAAVVATSVAVVSIPTELPAHAESVHVQPYSQTPEQEPDRAIGPAADGPTPEKGESSSPSDDATFSDETGTDQTQDQPIEAAQAPSPEGSPPVKVAVDQTGAASASVSAGGIDVSVSVDVRKPLDTQVEIKGVEETVQRTVDEVTQRVGVDEVTQKVGVDEVTEPKDDNATGSVEGDVEN
jgi:RNA polymerase sigma factor (sigma-70 family)